MWPKLEMTCGSFPVDETECGGECGVAFSSWLGMCYGVQQLPGNVTENVALCSAAGRELWRGVQRLVGNVAGKLALRPAAGRECGGKCGAAFSGRPGMWREMWRGGQQLAGNVIKIATGCPSSDVAARKGEIISSQLVRAATNAQHSVRQGIVE